MQRSWVACGWRRCYSAGAQHRPIHLPIPPLRAGRACRGCARTRRLAGGAFVQRAERARERAAVGRVRHRGSGDHVVARRLHAVALPLDHRVEGLDLFGDREVAVRDAAHRALHQPAAVALGRHALVVDLLHAEGHVQVAQRVQRDHRNPELAIGLGNPAQAVGAQAVGIGRRGQLEHRGVQRRGARHVAVDGVGEAVGVERAPVQDAVDRAIAAEHAPYRRERAALREAQVEHRPLAAREVLHHRAELQAGGRGRAREGGVQRARDLRPDVQPVDARVLGQPCQRLRGNLRARKVVEQFGVAHHAAHRHRAVVLHLVVGGGVGLVLDGRRRDVAAHRMARDVDPRGRRELAAVGLGDGVELQGQRVGVFHARAHVVEILAVARGGPGVAVLDQEAADGGVVHLQQVAFAGVAMRVHHELAVPVGGHLDAVLRAAEHAGPAAGGGVVDGVAGVGGERREGGGRGIGGREGVAAVLQAGFFGRRGRWRRRCRRRGCRRRRQWHEGKAVAAAAPAAGGDGKAGCKGKKCQACGMHGMSLSVLVLLGRSPAQRSLARP